MDEQKANKTSSTLHQTDWAWWQQLDDLWKKIFTAHIYHEDKTINNATFGDNSQFVAQYGTTQLPDKQDLSKITKLTKLFYIAKHSSDQFKLTDITPLAYLTNLQWLSLTHNQIQDIKPLADLTNLTKLSLEHNQIQDITPLADLTNLTRLSLWKNLAPKAKIDWLKQQLPNCKILSNDDGYDADTDADDNDDLADDYQSDYDVLFIHANIASFNTAFGFGHNDAYGQILDGIVGIKDGIITWVSDGNHANAHTLKNNAKKIIDCQQKWLTPALIDCHTHLVYGGNRSNEFEMRLNGIDYRTIAQNGGGILSTVQATRALSFDELYELSAVRLQDFIHQGVGTIEIKSGYGLDLASERKMLQVAQKLGECYPIHVQKTYLALHALPPEYQDNADDYVNLACEWLRQLHAEGLVDAVDAFCENIAFNREQVQKLFCVAKELNLPVKLHAEQLSDMNGAGLVADFDGLSADHIEYLSQENILKMHKKNVVGVLLPTAFYTLKETKAPPIDLMRQHNVQMAVSTDCNPGTSPSTSLLLAINMACTLFKLTPAEALAGATVYASQALGLQARKGQIKVGMDADLALWHIDRPADLAYLIGQNRLSDVWIAGNKTRLTDDD